MYTHTQSVMCEYNFFTIHKLDVHTQSNLCVHNMKNEYSDTNLNSWNRLDDLHCGHLYQVDLIICTRKLKMLMSAKPQEADMNTAQIIQQKLMITRSLQNVSKGILLKRFNNSLRAYNFKFQGMNSSKTKCHASFSISMLWWVIYANSH